MLMVQRSLVAFGRTRRYRPYGRDDKEGEHIGSPKQHCTFYFSPSPLCGAQPLITNKGSSFELNNYTLNNKQHTTYNILTTRIQLLYCRVNRC